MSGTIEAVQQPHSGQNRILNFGLLLAGVIIVVSFVFYARLLGPVQYRELVIPWFFRRILPVAAAHTAGVCLVSLFFKARGALLYWILSTIVLLAAGGAIKAGSFLALAAFGVVLVGMGDGLSRLILPQSSRGWGAGLAFGIAATSAGGAWLASWHLFRWWIVGPLIVAAFLFAVREGDSPLQRFREGWTGLTSRWNVSVALALEAIFLVAVFLFVAASPPETDSDAIRVYWPYLKLLKQHAGFVDVPYHWSYIIPQAGLTYAGTVLLLLGPIAVRWAMFLAWLALIAIACRSRLEARSDVAMAVVAVMAACPVLLQVTASVMQDAFVCLIVVLLAVVCLQGSPPGSIRYWIAVGSLVGVAWCAKYTTLAYAAPLLLCAVVRSCRETGWKTNLKGAGTAAACCLSVAAPWLWHTYRQSGNPFFPFFLNLFPAPLWPNGVGRGYFDAFRLPSGLRGWFLWPIDMTYHTDRFMEGYPGSLGLILVVALVLLIPAVWKGSWWSRALVFSGAAGTALLWVQTAYLRYWLPGLWLLVLGVATAASGLFRLRLVRIAASTTAVVLVLFQLPLAMLSSWLDPGGWPWDYYSGKINDDDYIERAYPGFRKFRQLDEMQRGWPRVWVTGYEVAGHFQVCPLDALIWEIELHGAPDPRSKVQYLGSTGCRYWIVNESSGDAKWFRLTGVAPFYWNQQSLVASEGSASIYRMKSSQEAVRAFDARAQPGTDLMLDGGFEMAEATVLKYWTTAAGTTWVSPSVDAHEGKSLVAMVSGGSLGQYIPLPPGLKTVDLSVRVRAAESQKPVSLGVDSNWNGRAGEFIAGESRTVTATSQWVEHRITLPVPDAAVYAVVHFSNRGVGSGVLVDDAHLYSREKR